MFETDLLALKLQNKVLLCRATKLGAGCVMCGGENKARLKRKLKAECLPDWVENELEQVKLILCFSATLLVGFDMHDESSICALNINTNQT